LSSTVKTRMQKRSSNCCEGSTNFWPKRCLKTSRQRNRELGNLRFPVFFTSPFLYSVHLCLKPLNYFGATRQTIRGIKKDSTKECCKTEGQENERNKYDNELERRESYP